MFLSLIFATLSFTFACEPLNSVDSSLQIAWISPVQEQVRGKQSIEVVSYAALQPWIAEEEPDAKSLLHQMGMISKRSKREIDPSDYKIVIFDIESERLCRPVDTEEVGTMVEGVAVCEMKQSRKSRMYSRYGFTGCGYTQSTKTMSRGFDVYRVSWGDAATWGFCVMPLDRFLNGSPK
jgi:hypothetical protein